MKVLRFIGIDINILDYCSAEEQFYNKAFNVLQILLILIVGASTYYLFEIIFEITWMSIVLAIFWSFVFYNLYRFILMTTSGKVGETANEKLALIIPNLFKIFVIGFFAVFISLPIELFINRQYIEDNLPAVLDKKIAKVKEEIDIIYETQYKEIDKKIKGMQEELNELDTLILQQEAKMKLSESNEEQRQIFKYLNKLHTERALKHEKYKPVIYALSKELSNIDYEKEQDLSQYVRIIKGSNLLLERFELLFTDRALSGFFLAAFIVILFLLPLLYKLFSLYKLGYQYEKVINDRNKHEILYHYHLFKERYKKITLEVLGAEEEFIERYEDAPFNNIKKTETILKEEKGQFSKDLIEEHNGG